jgi:hypothetical protein
MSRLIDLSKPIRYNADDPWYMRVKIKHKAHGQARWLIRFLGLPFRLFPKHFTGWADDTIQSIPLSKWVCTPLPTSTRPGTMVPR